jgi:hypothetical protein
VTCVAFFPRVCPEILNLVIGSLYASAILLFVQRRFQGKAFVWVFGIVNGLNIATKISAAPLALIPLILLSDWRARARFVLITILTFVLATIPAWPSYLAMIKWFGKIATHTRMYGGGPVGLVDGELCANFVRMLCQEYLLQVIAIPVGALAAAALLWKRSRTAADSSRAHALCLLAVSLAQLAQIIIVAKHPRMHYLIPALTLFGLNLVLYCRLGQNFLGRSAVPALLATIILWFAVWQGPLIRDVFVRRAQVGAERLAFAAEVKQHHAGSPIFLGPRTSSPGKALYFGNFWAGWQYSVELNERHPDVFTFENERFGRFDESHRSLTTELDNLQTVLLHASPLMPPVADTGVRIEEIFRSGNDALYRLTRVPSEPVQIRFTLPDEHAH